MIAAIKTELTSRRPWPARFDLELAVAGYNHGRLHRDLGGRTPPRSTTFTEPPSQLRPHNSDCVEPGAHHADSVAARRRRQLGPPSTPATLSLPEPTTLKGRDTRTGGIAYADRRT